MSDFAQQLTKLLPTLIRSAGVGGLTTAADVRAFESRVIEAVAGLEIRARGSRIFQGQLLGAQPDPSLGLEGDLFIEIDTLDFYTYVDGVWGLLVNLMPRTSAFVPATQNEYATHPAFTTERAWLIWLTQNLGSAVAPPAPTVPGVVVMDTPTPGDGQVALSWAAPVNTGGAAIISYTVKYRPVGASTYSVFGTTANRSITVTGLANGTAEQFIVLATNSVGTGSASAAVTATPVAASRMQFAPTSGAPGNEVILTGLTGLTGATAVTLNGVPAFSFVVNSDTQITATVPANGSTGVWTITKADGSTVSSTGSFTYAMPTITATSQSKTASTNTVNIVCGISSLTYGSVSPANNNPGPAATGGSPDSWPGKLRTKLLAQYGSGNVAVRNAGIPGQTLQQAIAAYDTDVAAYFNATAGVQNWYIIEVFANELFVNGQNNTAAAGLDLLDTLINKARATGFQVGLCTDTPRQLNQDFQDKIAVTNPVLRGPRYAAKRHFVADVGATVLGDAGGGLNAVTNTRWYDADECHRTVAAYELIAQLVSLRLNPWLNAVVPVSTGPVYVEDPSESAVPFAAPSLQVASSATAQIIATTADGSRGQAVGTTSNFANTVRTVKAFAPVSTQWVGEVKFIVQDLQDKVFGLGGAAVTTWPEINYGIYLNASGGGGLKMAGVDATLESGAGTFSGVAPGTVFKLRLTQTHVYAYRDGTQFAAIARTETISLYAVSCMTLDQSITAFLLRAYQLV